MDFRHLRAFVAVAEERSFTKAAQRLHLSQPPLSRHVRQLEDELGVPLLIRRRVGVELTSAGRVLLEKARSISVAVEDFQELARSVKNPRQRTVTIAICWGLWEAVDRIRAHHAGRFPEMLISVQDLCEHGWSAVRRHIDVALLRGAVEDTQFESQVLFEEQFVAILGDTHPLAARKAVKLSELASDPLLLYDRCAGPGVYDKTLALYRTAGFQPRVVEGQPPPYTQPAMMLVASRQGFYVGIESPFTQTHRVSGIAVVPLDEPDARIEIQIAWRKNESSGAVRELLRSARDAFPLGRELARSGAA